MESLRDEKYEIRNGKIINRSSGRPIPDGEPVFIFRAQDRKTLTALEAYILACENQSHREAVKKRYADFIRFSVKHPERMKEPDTAQ